MKATLKLFNIRLSNILNKQIQEVSTIHLLFKVSLGNLDKVNIREYFCKLISLIVTKIHAEQRCILDNKKREVTVCLSIFSLIVKRYSIELWSSR